MGLDSRISGEVLIKSGAAGEVGEKLNERLADTPFLPGAEDTQSNFTPTRFHPKSYSVDMIFGAAVRSVGCRNLSS